MPVLERAHAPVPLRVRMLVRAHALEPVRAPVLEHAHEPERVPGRVRGRLLFG